MPIWEPQTTRPHSTSLAHRRRAWPPPALKEPANAGRVTPQRWQMPRTWSAAQWLCATLVLAFLTLARPAQAQEEDTLRAGTLFFDGASGRREAPRVHTDIHMDVSGLIASVEVRQRFHNPSDQWVEGIYAFPLPESAAVNRLHMQVGERVIIGEIREKAAAQQLFQQARANGQRASVVHQQRPNIFRTAVANIAVPAFAGMTRVGGNNGE